jgi:hypothetical protein
MPKGDLIRQWIQNYKTAAADVLRAHDEEYTLIRPGCTNKDVCLCACTRGEAYRFLMRAQLDEQRKLLGGH